MTVRATIRPGPRERIGSAVAVALVTGGLGWLLAGALALHVPRTDTPALATFDVPPPPPIKRPPPPPLRRAAHRARQAPAPAGKRAIPTPIVAPVPIVPLPVPPPVVAAQVAGVGAASSAGAADRGTGTGAGGDGNGRGGGGDGDGGQDERLIRDKKPGQLPPAARRLNGVRTVGMRWIVGTDGRIHDCRVTRSSGDAELDAETCTLLTTELRYAPALDRLGRKIPVTIDDAEQRWDVVHETGGSKDAD